MVDCRVVEQKTSSSLDDLCAYLFGRDGVTGVANLNDSQSRELLAEFRRRCADAGVFADVPYGGRGKRRLEAFAKLKALFIV